MSWLAVSGKHTFVRVNCCSVGVEVSSPTITLLALRGQSIVLISLTLSGPAVLMIWPSIVIPTSLPKALPLLAHNRKRAAGSLQLQRKNKAPSKCWWSVKVHSILRSSRSSRQPFPSILSCSSIGSPGFQVTLRRGATLVCGRLPRQEGSPITQRVVWTRLSPTALWARARRASLLAEVWALTRRARIPHGHGGGVLEVLGLSSPARKQSISAYSRLMRPISA